MRFPQPSFALVLGLSLAGAAAAGEIVLQPERSDAAPGGARRERERAAAYQMGGEIQLPEDEAGFLSPRGGAPAEERAYGNRMRARSYQPGSETAPAARIASPGSEQMIPATPSESARGMRVRGQGYGSGSGQEFDLSQVGPDGIPVVPCKDAGNVAARIGEDAPAGGLFYIFRNGKQVKVRCK